MQIKFFNKLFFVCLFVIAGLTSCKSTQYGYAVKNEQKDIAVKESRNVLDYAALKQQNIPTFASRGASGANRGLPIAGAISLATSAIKKMIAEDRKKYTASYTFATTDLYFYDQLSTESAFDPVGLQFKGFRLVRTYVNKEGDTDTSFTASFVIDSTRSNEIVNNSIFRLKLQDLTIYKTKAKITAGQKNSINMDVEITISSSYVNSMGQLFTDVETGKFYLLLRNAPLDKNSAGYAEYYNKLKGKSLDGKSFIIPRSYGYYIDQNGESKPCYSQGAYAISVKVKESSKDKFVAKMLLDNSSQIIDGVGSSAKKLANSLQK
jgi:hypothetical protein